MTTESSLSMSAMTGTGSMTYVTSRESVTVTAPATVANVGAGYDVFGFAVDSPVDTVHARLLESPSPSSSLKL